MIDRPIRPLFPAGWRYETQIIALVLSADTENDTDVLAITGASAALALSEIPFQKTIAGVRVGLVDGQYVINPTFEQRKQSKLDLIVAGSKDGLVMVEAGAKEVTEEQVVEALEAAHAAIKQIVADDRRPREGRPARRSVEVAEEGDRPRLLPRGRREGLVPLTEAMRIRGKLENYDRVDQVLDELVASLPEGEVERKVEAKPIFKELKEKVLRDEVLDARRPPRRPQVRRGASDLDRNRRPAAHARLGRVHARRDAGARHLHARHRRRCAEDRELRGRDAGRASCSTTTSRRSRSAKSRSCAVPAAAKSATARWRSAR